MSAVAENMQPVAIRALIRMLVPAGEASRTEISGAIVIPVMMAKAAKRILLSGLFLLQTLEEKMMTNSTAKKAYISHGISMKYWMK